MKMLVLWGYHFRDNSPSDPYFFLSPFIVSACKHLGQSALLGSGKGCGRVKRNNNLFLMESVFEKLRVFKEMLRYRENV